MKKKILIIIVVFLLVMGLGVGGYFYGEEIWNKFWVVSEEEMKQCTEHSDCIFVNQECCPCQNGGSRTAINKDFLKMWNDHLECPEDLNCSMVYLCNPNVAPRCVNNVCKVKKGDYEIQ